jgi:hypothetical protein
MPGENTVLSDFNTLAKNLSLPIEVTEIIRTNNSDDFYSLRQPDINQPLFEGFFRTVQPNIEEPRFYKYFKVLNPKEAERILSFKNNDAFFLQISKKKGQVLFFSSYIDDEWTNFQYRGLFLPFLSRIMYFSVSASSQVNVSHRIGKSIFLQTRINGVDNKFYLIDNDDNRNTIVPKIIDQTYQFSLSQIDKPGLYKIKSDNQLRAVIPVNCRVNIIETPFIDIEEMQSNINQLEIFNERMNFLEKVIESRFGVELWKLFVLFCVIFIITEFILIKRMEGKQRF